MPLEATTNGPTRAPRGKAAVPLRSWVALGFGLLVGLLFSGMAGRFVHQKAEDQLRWTLRDLGAERHLLIERELAVAAESLLAVRSFFHASQHVSQEEFRTFTSSLLKRRRGLAALEWIPRVTDDTRVAHEKHLQADGDAQYRIWEMGPDGGRIPATRREEHFPVQYVVPLAGNDGAVGFDLASDPRRRGALERARRLNTYVATAPVGLVQDEEKTPCVLLLLPIFRKLVPATSAAAHPDALLGYALAVIRVGDLIEQTLAGYPQDSIDILVTDITTAGENEWIHTHHSAPTPGAGASIDEPGAEPPRFSQEIEVGGRRWRLTSIASEQLSEPWFSWGPWAVFGAGVLGTLLLTGFFLTVMRQNASLSAAFTSLEGEVAERQRAEEARLRLEDQLRQSQKMEALGTLAGGIAHDFNNVLTGIILNAEGIAQANDEDSSNARRAREVLQGAGHAKDLVRGILTFSRQMEPSLYPTDLHDALRLGLRMLHRTLPKMVEIRARLEARRSIVMGDPNQLNRVLLNLGTNAQDAMPDGRGLLEVITRNVTPEEVGLDAGPNPGGYVELTVTDDGRGMSPETRDRIFDPFFTRKEVGQGTGLGLSIVYGIIQGHGGQISCTSAPGDGTTFRILLPVLSGGAPATTAAAAPRTPAPSEGTGRILVVDDEEFLVHLMRTILEKPGYDVLTASNGEEALDVFRQQGGEIDLVVLDISMPGMGGHECFRRLLEIRDDVKVLVSSGYALDGKVQDTLDLGAAGFLAKPYSNDEFLAMIRSALSA
jgi:signal transduction histidine kinase